MKRIAALLIMTFTLHGLVCEAGEKTSRALAPASVEMQQSDGSLVISDSDSGNNLLSAASDNSDSSQTIPLDGCCAHAANCCYVLRSLPSFVGPNYSDSSPSILEATLVSVILEDPTKPPLT